MVSETYVNTLHDITKTSYGTGDGKCQTHVLRFSSSKKFLYVTRILLSLTFGSRDEESDIRRINCQRPSFPLVVYRVIRNRNEVIINTSTHEVCHLLNFLPFRQSTIDKS